MRKIAISQTEDSLDQGGNFRGGLFFAGDKFAITDFWKTGWGVFAHVELAFFGKLSHTFSAGKNVTVLGKAGTTFEAIVDTHVVFLILVTTPSA